MNQSNQDDTVFDQETFLDIIYARLSSDIDTSYNIQNAPFDAYSIDYKPKPIEESVPHKVQDVVRLYSSKLGATELYFRTNYAISHMKFRVDEFLVYKHFIWQVFSGFRALPVFKGKVYRCSEEKLPPKGSHIVWNNFTSCTLSQETAKQALQNALRKNYGTLFEIDSLEGRMLHDFQKAPIEEIMFEPASEFYVIGVTQQDKWCQVHMRQIPQQHRIVLEATPVLDTNVVTAPPASPAVAKARKLTIDALKAWPEGKYQVAYEFCHAAISVSPCSFIVPTLLLRVFVREKSSLFPNPGREFLINEMLAKVRGATEIETREAHAVLHEALSHSDSVASAQALLATLYYWGVGVGKDNAEAARLYKLSSDAGNIGSKYNLGVCYQYGYGVPKNFEEAARLYSIAATEGNPTAQCNLGCCYQFSIGLPSNSSKGTFYYRLSAEQGNAVAQENLAYCYLQGIGVEKNEKEAMRLLHLSSEQGNLKAAVRLGECYQGGYGTTKDVREAVKVIRYAALHGFD